MSPAPHKILYDELVWQVIQLSVKSSCKLEALTETKTRQSVKQKTTTDLHCGFILVGKMTNSMLQLADDLEEEKN